MKPTKIAEGLKHPSLISSFIKSKTIDPAWAHTRMGFFPDLVSEDIARMKKFGHLMKRCGAKTTYLRTSGARVLENSKVTGRIDVDDPRRVQINRSCRVKDLTVSGDAYLLVDNNLDLEDVFIEKDTIFTRQGVVQGKRLFRPVITFSIDLEAGVGLAHSSRVKEIFKNPRAWNYTRESTIKLLKLLSQHEIPATWFVCGHLFLESCDGKHLFNEKEWYGDWLKYDPAVSYVENKAWYMPDIVEKIAENSLFDLGYHSFGHFNYIESSNQTIIEDVEMAKKIRKDFSLDLLGFSCPWNEVSRLHILHKGGFRNVRGWIGTAEANGLTVFDESVRFFHTSEFLNPRIDFSELVRKCIDNSVYGPFNVFMHPHDWVSQKDFSKLALFLSRINELRKTEEILIQRMDKV